ncbi:MAG: hypothetical protein EOL95_08915 [Bacteroidia bacterium]|nr:hypothetical protein [Bacteroidia bacterium]
MRLNCGIKPELLSDEHLFAEQRELKMLPSLYKRIGDSSLNKCPETFKLGSGHMLFFVYKPNYTYNRYNLVYNECIKRGYKIENESFRWTDAYGEAFLKHPDYVESGNEKQILIDRITTKILKSPKQFFHYNHKQISKSDLIEKLKSMGQ